MWVWLKGTGSPVAHDDIVKVLEGVGKSYPCKTTFPDRVWIGAIQYITILEEITTNFFGRKQIARIMFNDVASNGLRMIGMDVHMAAEKEVSVEVFAKAWRYDCREFSSRTPHKWRKEQSRAETRASEWFQPGLWPPKQPSCDLRYPSGQFFTSPGANDVMSVTRGVGRNYPFGDAYPARVWNGAFKYTYTCLTTPSTALNSDFVAAPLLV